MSPSSTSWYIGLIQDGAVRCKMSGMADVTSRIFRWSPGDLFRQDQTKFAWVSYCSTYTVVFGDAHSRTECPGGQVCKKIHKHLLWPSWNHLTRCSLMFLKPFGVLLYAFVLNWKWKETAKFVSWNVFPSADVRSKTSHELASFVSLATQLRCKSLQNGSDQVRICMPRWRENFCCSCRMMETREHCIHYLHGLMWPWLKQHAEFSFARFCKHSQLASNTLASSVVYTDLYSLDPGTNQHLCILYYGNQKTVSGSSDPRQDAQEFQDLQRTFEPYSHMFYEYVICMY